MPAHRHTQTHFISLVYLVFVPICLCLHTDIQLSRLPCICPHFLCLHTDTHTLHLSRLPCINPHLLMPAHRHTDRLHLSRLPCICPHVLMSAHRHTQTHFISLVCLVLMCPHLRNTCTQTHRTTSSLSSFALYLSPFAYACTQTHRHTHTLHLSSLPCICPHLLMPAHTHRHTSSL